MRLDLNHIKQQLNASSASKSIEYAGVKGLIIGAVVITERDTPYPSNITMTKAIEDEIIDQVINSVNYIIRK